MRKPITAEEGEFHVPATTGDGDPKRVHRFDLVGAAIHLVRTSGTFQLQGTIDGTNWFDIGAALSASTVIVLTHQCFALRFQCDSNGTATAQLQAFEELH